MTDYFILEIVVVVIIAVVAAAVLVWSRVSVNRWNSYASSPQYRVWRDGEEIKRAARDARIEMNKVIGKDSRNQFE